jgi:hypothetical protein
LGFQQLRLATIATAPVAVVGRDLGHEYLPSNPYEPAHKAAKQLLLLHLSLG